MTRNKPIETVLREHADQLTSMMGVVGTAIGAERGEPCIKVFVATRDKSLRERIPRILDGHPVVVQRTGKIRALRERLGFRKPGAGS